MCVHKGRREIIVGTHKKKIYGKEQGHEIVCDGTIYKEQYSTAMQWFIYVYTESVSFVPMKSNSLNLRQWAANNCR